MVRTPRARAASATSMGTALRPDWLTMIRMSGGASRRCSTISCP